jgi:transcriptional regulator with XRE-family HTH domain
MTPFATELRRVMGRKGLQPTSLARLVGMDRSVIDNLVRGRARPMLDTAAKLGEFLDADNLVPLAITTRQADCPICGDTFIDYGRKVRRYCSDSCRKTYHRRAQVPRNEARTASGLRRSNKRLKKLRAAVDEMCRTCEPEGFCRDAACPLQVAKVSPLQLARVRAA